MKTGLGGDEIREKTGNLGFHYDRNEREKLRTSEVEIRRGWLRGNRPLIITLIDVVIVVVMLILYLLFLRPAAQNTRIGDFRIRGTAFLYDSQVLVALRVRSDEDQLATGPANVLSRQIEVRSGEFAFIDLLPPPGGETIIRFRVDRSGQGDLPVEILIGEEMRTITVPVSSE